MFLVRYVHVLKTTGPYSSFDWARTNVVIRSEFSSRKVIIYLQASNNRSKLSSLSVFVHLFYTSYTSPVGKYHRMWYGQRKFWWWCIHWISYIDFDGPISASRPGRHAVQFLRGPLRSMPAEECQVQVKTHSKIEIEVREKIEELRIMENRVCSCKWTGFALRNHQWWCHSGSIIQLTSTVRSNRVISLLTLTGGVRCNEARYCCCIGVWKESFWNHAAFVV